jgi:glucokinase
MSGVRNVVAAVDVGGTSFKGALIDASGRSLIIDSRPTEGAQGEAVFALLQDFVAGLLEAGTAQGLAPKAIGVIAPGMDERSGRVMFSSNLGWRNFPLGARLASGIDLPMALGHDVRTAGVAEAMLGAAREVRDSALIMIGTGIAAALVTDGHPIAGAGQMACEIGHAPVYPGGEPCPCGQFGCLETYAAAAAIARRYRTMGGAGAPTAAEIAARLGGDPVADRVWDDAVQALSISLTTVTMLLDPSVIVIGGGLAEADAVLLRPLEAALAKRLAWRPAPPILRSRLGARGALLGAAILAFRKLELGHLASRWQPG